MVSNTLSSRTAITAVATLLATAPLAALALDPSCAPGGNFDLSKWNLQLPIGSENSPTTIKPAQLQGCDGWQNFQYFFTESGDGALVMKVPGSPASQGCVTTPNSKHCRTELREVVPSSWDPNAAKNTLSATLAVEYADDSNHGTVIGQIHIDEQTVNSTKPVCELFYKADGTISMGVEKNRDGNSLQYTPIGQIAPGQVFSYTISYAKNQLSVSLNGAAAKVLSTYDLNAPRSYFKVGNYNQGDAASDVHFFAISTSH